MTAVWSYRSHVLDRPGGLELLGEQSSQQEVLPGW